jgi:hypothetical protein
VGCRGKVTLLHPLWVNTEEESGPEFSSHRTLALTLVAGAINVAFIALIIYLQ